LVSGAGFGASVLGLGASVFGAGFGAAVTGAGFVGWVLGTGAGAEIFDDLTSTAIAWLNRVPRTRTMHNEYFIVQNVRLVVLIILF